MKELLKKYKLTIFLTIVILILLTLIVKKLIIFLNARNNNKNINTQIKSNSNIINTNIVKDKFYDAPTTTTSTPTTSSTSTSTNTRYNEITYGMNPDCVSANSAARYCPNSHPNIPCSMVTNCKGNDNKNITDEMKRDIYMYIYLTGLLKTSDVFNSDNDRYWYNSLDDKPPTSSTN